MVTVKLSENLSEDERSALQEYKQNIQESYDGTQEQRDHSNDDNRYVNVTGGAWEDTLTDSLSFNGDANVTSQNTNSDRLKLDFDIVTNYVMQYLAEWNNNRVDVEYQPTDLKTSEEDAELMNGIYRADYRMFGGKLAVENAVKEAAITGFGAFKIGTRFEDPADPESDLQRADFRPIYEAYNTVYYDPDAKSLIKDDAKYVTSLPVFTKEAFERKWPGFNPVSAFTPDTRAYNNFSRSTPELVYVGVRYEKRKEIIKYSVFRNIATGEVESYHPDQMEEIEDELREDEFRDFLFEKPIKRPFIEKAVFNGEDFLEKPRRIAGTHLPIIPIYGRQAFIDGVEWWEGLVRSLKDAGRLFNMQMSQLAENASGSGQEVPVFTPEEIAGHEAEWADKNNKPYLLKNRTPDNNGNTVKEPTEYHKPPQLDGYMATLINAVPAFIQQKTGRQPMEVTNPSDSSLAIKEAKKIEDLNTGTINDNIEHAIAHGGDVYLGIAQEIYSGNRIIQTISRDGTKRNVELLKSVIDEDTGKIVEANDINGKRFHVFSSTGPQYDTLRQETADHLKDILEVLPSIPGGQQYTPAVLAMLLDNIKGVGLGPLKELNRKLMIIQGLVKPDTDEEKQMLAQAQQPQSGEQEQLMQALTAQLVGEANESTAKARELDTQSIENEASARLIVAQAVETLKKAEATDRESVAKIIDALTNLSRETREEVQDLPFSNTLQ